MSLQVEEEHILPGFVLDRTRFDLAQVDSASGKRLKHAMKNPRLISHRKDQRSFVILARRRILIPDSQKARKDAKRSFEYPRRGRCATTDCDE